MIKGNCDGPPMGFSAGSGKLGGHHCADTVLRPPGSFIMQVPTVGDRDLGDQGSMVRTCSHLLTHELIPRDPSLVIW